MSEAITRADLWLARESPRPEVVVVGVPWAKESPGVALAPMAMRDRLSRFFTYHSERGTDFGHIAVSDAGNWPVSQLTLDELHDHLVERSAGLPEAGITLFVGGEEAITHSLLASAGDATKGLIRFSCRPQESLANLAGYQVFVIGVHTFAAAAEAVSQDAGAGIVPITNDQIEKEGVRMTVDRALGKLSMVGTIHVSVDMNALDRIHAPGSATSLPGGLTIRQLSEAVRRCAANGKVRSLDFVGADVERDTSGLTTDALCHLFLSAVTGYAERGSSS